MSEITASNSKVRIGMIGTGGRLRGVVRRLLQSDTTGRLEIVAAYDPDSGSLDTLDQVFGKTVRRAASDEALINDPEVDWVFIGSWNSEHARQSVAALNAGKNVFCEKPLATEFEGCLAIRDAVARTGKAFAFGLVLRYSPHYVRLKEVLESGVIGKIISFEFNETLGFNHGGYIFGNWRRKRANAGTHLLEKCCHDIDLANWMIGSLPVQVASFGGRDFFTPENQGEVERIGPNAEGKAAFSLWPDPHHKNPFDGEADIFDNQVAILQYANGVRGTFHTNVNASLRERRFYICGTRGSIRADLVSGIIEVRENGWTARSEVYDTNAGDGHGGGDEVMANSLLATLTQGTAPAAGVLEGLHSALAAFALDEAADTGKVVDVRELWCRAGVEVF